MRLSEICIRRPVLSWVMTLIIFVLGLVGFSYLGVQYYPTIEYPVVTIESSYAGASGSVVEQAVTRVIEEAIAGIDGVDYTQSISSLGESKITVQFSKGKNIDRGVDEIRDRLFRIQNQELPREMPTPTIRRYGGSGNYIMSLALRFKGMDDQKKLGELAEFSRNEIEKELESIKGVAQVSTYGGGLYKMYIYLDPTKLAINNVSVRDVIDSVYKHNFEESAGQLKTQEREYTVTVLSNLEKPIQFEEMPVLEREGRVIRVKDLGRVELISEDRSTSRFNGQRVVSISITKQAMANPIEIANAVKNKIPLIQTKLKEGMILEVATDNTKYIDVSVKQVYRTIAEAVLFVTLVVLVFLASVRASLIPLITIPVSLMGTFFFIYLLGFSINMFSLAAIVLAVGLVVDDAIVVLENTHRYIERGLKPFDAAIKGINEIGFSVVAMTLTLAAVYAPTALAQGATARMMMEFALTLAISVLISGFVALTLSPMMCARMLSEDNLTNFEKVVIRWIHEKIKIEERLSYLEDLYEKYLSQVLNMKRNALILVSVFALVGFGLYRYIPKDLNPAEDSNTITISGEAPQAATLEFTDKYLKMLDEKLSQFKEIEKRDAKVENINHYKIYLTLADQHKKSTAQLISEISKIYASIPGINARVRSEDNQSGWVQFAVRGNKDIGQLWGCAQSLHQTLVQAGLVQAGGMLSSQHSQREEFIITIDEKVDALKIDPRSISSVIRGLMRGEKSTTFKEEKGRKYDVMVAVDKEFSKTIDDYLKIYYKPQYRNEDIRIPLGELIKIESKMGYPNVLHYQKSRMVDVFCKLKPGVDLMSCVKVLKNAEKKALPDDIYLVFIGETKKFLEESQVFILIFALALCFIYLVLAAQFESWRDPFIIILSVPLSLAGGIIGLLIFFAEPQLTLWGNIGFITLVGLITKHGIMMVDFANHLMESGQNASLAIINACKIRLRPILMTTSAMVLGSIPLLLMSGPTQKANNELGAVIIGGLLFGTFLTLFFVPCVYVYFKDNKNIG